MADFRELVKKFIKETNDDIKTDIREKAPKLGEYLSINVAKGLEESDEHTVRAFEGLYEKLRYQRDFDLISEGEYYRELELLRNQYLKKGTQEWMKYTLEIFKYQKKQFETEQENLTALFETEKKSITKLYDNIVKYASGKLDEVIKKHRATTEEINSFGNLFNVNTVLMNGKKDTFITLHDIEHDIGVIKRYGQTIEDVKARISTLGLDEEKKDILMTALNSLGVEEGLGLASALMRADDETFTKYAASLQEKRIISEGISARRYEEEFETGWNDAYSNMKKELEKAGYEIPDGFYTSGSISAEKFGQGFVEGLDAQLATIRTKIDEFNLGIGIGNAFSYSGDTYNTTNNSYNIQSQDGIDTVEAIKRMETVKRLSGVS